MSQNGLFTVAEAAQELNTEPVRILRLIARRKLKATRLAHDKQWRIASDDLVAYVRAGADDLRGPKFLNGWFDHMPRAAAGAFRAAILEEAKKFTIDDEALSRLWRKDLSQRHITVELQLSDPMKAIAAASATPSFVRIAGQEPPEFSTQGDAYLAVQLRSAARPPAQQGYAAPFADDLTKLYDSPEQYDSVVDKAITTVASGNLAYREPRQIERVTLTVYYRISHDKLATASQMRALAVRAF